jgi:hypothetical protein
MLAINDFSLKNENFQNSLQKDLFTNHVINFFCLWKKKFELLLNNDIQCHFFQMIYLPCTCRCLKKVQEQVFICFIWIKYGKFNFRVLFIK